MPNHVSDQHPWFRAALAAGPGSPERELFRFRPGRGEHGELPPNDWQSRVRRHRLDPAADDGEWYLHLFAPEQPDLNWAHPAVRQEHEDVLRFWFDRGVDGRPHRLGRPARQGPRPARLRRGPRPAPVRRPGRAARHLPLLAAPSPTSTAAVFVGEVWLPDTERFARYLRPDELHTAFNFNFLGLPLGRASGCARSIDETLAEHAPVGAPATWVLCNHDVTRTVTRYGRADTGFDFATKAFGTPTDLELGTRRARAAALLSLALPGSVYLYQGEELGLPGGRRYRCDRIQDPMHFRSGGADPGRDGCRVPLPWAADEPHAGFGSTGEPWLPQPDGLGRLRRRPPGRRPRLDARALPRGAPAAAPAGFGDGPLTWLPAPDGVLAFARGATAWSAWSTSPDTPADLPAHSDVLLGQRPPGRPTAGCPQDTAVWLRA